MPCTACARLYHGFKLVPSIPLARGGEGETSFKSLHPKRFHLHEAAEVQPLASMKTPSPPLPSLSPPLPPSRHHHLPYLSIVSPTTTSFRRLLSPLRLQFSSVLLLPLWLQPLFFVLLSPSMATAPLSHTSHYNSPTPPFRLPRTSYSSPPTTYHCHHPHNRSRSCCTSTMSAASLRFQILSVCEVASNVRCLQAVSEVTLVYVRCRIICNLSCQLSV